MTDSNAENNWMEPIAQKVKKWLKRNFSLEIDDEQNKNW